MAAAKPVRKPPVLERTGLLAPDTERLAQAVAALMRRERARRNGSSPAARNGSSRART